MMMCGQLPSLAMTLRRSIVSTLPTMSSSVFGRCCRDRSDLDERAKLVLSRVPSPPCGNSSQDQLVRDRAGVETDHGSS